MSAPPTSPEKLAGCTHLCNTWARCDRHRTSHHDGHEARAEPAIHRCRQGRYDEGIPGLKALLRRGRFTIPD